MRQWINRETLALSPFEIILLIGLVGIGLITFIVLMEKSHRRILVEFGNGEKAYIPLKLTTAGIVPASWAASIVMLPATIAGFIANPTAQQIAGALRPGRPVYFIAIVITIFFLYYLFTALFYKPEKMAETLRTKGASFVLPEGKGKREYIDRILEKMAFAGFLYLSIMVLFNEIANYFFNTFIVTKGYTVTITVTIIVLGGGGLVLIKMVAIALDILKEGKIRRKASLVRVAEFHDIPKAGLCKSLLEGQGISCHLRGYYYRALLYFFGPYIEVSVLVPQDKADEAKELINRYIE